MEAQNSQKLMTGTEALVALGLKRVGKAVPILEKLGLKPVRVSNGAQRQHARYRVEDVAEVRERQAKEAAEKKACEPKNGELPLEAGPAERARREALFAKFFTTIIEQNAEIIKQNAEMLDEMKKQSAALEEKKWHH